MGAFVSSCQDQSSKFKVSQRNSICKSGATIFYVLGCFTSHKTTTFSWNNTTCLSSGKRTVIMRSNLFIFSRWCASICPSVTPYLTTICCTASPRQQRSTTTTQEAPRAWTRLRQQQATWASSAGSTRCAEMGPFSTSSTGMQMSNLWSAGLYGDGDAHVHGWRPGHVWAWGVELPGLLWWLQRQVRRQAQSWVGQSSLWREGHRRSQQHHLQVDAAWNNPTTIVTTTTFSQNRDFLICLKRTAGFHFMLVLVFSQCVENI